MLRPNALGGNAEAYYAHLHQEDYYLRLDAEPGVWAGKGAKRLGLRGEVSPEQFKALFQGFDPLAPARKLVQNAGQMDGYRRENGEPSKGGRQPGWDLTMSAPKSLSAVYAMSGEDGRAWIRGQVTGAARDAVSFFEGQIVTRTGQGGRDRERTELVSSLFLHTTARRVGEAMPDPQLHVHAIVYNVGVSPRERAKDDASRPKTRTLKSEPFYQHQMAGGEVFRRALAERLAARYELLHDGGTWEVRGVPREVMDAFSKRSAEVTAVAPRGSSARAREVAALKTRQKKDRDLPRAQVEAAWAETGRAHGFTLENAHALKKEARARGPQIFSPVPSVWVGGPRVEVQKDASTDSRIAASTKSRVSGDATSRVLTARGEAVSTRRELQSVRDQEELAAALTGARRRGERIIALTWGNQERESLSRKMTRPPEQLRDHIGDRIRGREVPVHTISRLVTELSREPGQQAELTAKVRTAVGRARWQDRRTIERAHAFRKNYEVDERTTVVVHGERSEHEKLRTLEAVVGARGGKVVYSGDLLRAMRSREESRERAKEAGQELTRSRER